MYIFLQCVFVLSSMFLVQGFYTVLQSLVGFSEIYKAKGVGFWVSGLSV